MEKHIEIFEGSKRDLEDLTGKTYSAIKDEEGNLVKIRTPFGSKDRAKVICYLRFEAEIAKAHAVVNVNYFNEQSAAGNMELHGSGYLVKEVPKIDLTAKGWYAGPK